MAVLDRTTFEIGRELEYFSEKELQAQIGHGKGVWPLAILKELIDNSLDASETKGVAPKIKVVVEKNSFSVQDNGPGIEEEIITKSLDYTKRVSDKVHYISPTRGQLGNALKTVWAVPFVMNGKHGKVEVWIKGKHLVINVSEIYYDGVDWIFNPDALGSGDMVLRGSMSRTGVLRAFQNGSSSYGNNLYLKADGDFCLMKFLKMKLHSPRT